MCKYYAHKFKCKHVTYTFARFCNPASLIQTPCGKRQIWYTVDMGDDACEECSASSPELYPPTTGGGRAEGATADSGSRSRNKRR